VFVSRFVANYFAQKGDDVYAGTEGGTREPSPCPLHYFRHSEWLGLM
jgi:hypothetical protein